MQLWNSIRVLFDVKHSCFFQIHYQAASLWDYKHLTWWVPQEPPLKPVEDMDSHGDDEEEVEELNGDSEDVEAEKARKRQPLYYQLCPK